MNINDVKSKNSENQKLQGIKNYALNKAEASSDFSYYVEVSKTKESKNQSEQNMLSPQDDTQENELLANIDNQTDETNFAYVKSFQALNENLFNLGIVDDAVDKNFEKDYFKYNINLSDLTKDDIKLFQSLIKKSDFVINSFDSQTQTFSAIINGEGVNVSYRSLEVSNTLFIAIENAAKTGKAVRLDFDKDASVILKISKDGKLSADFIPNDKAMEIMLKNALPELKAKLDAENLPYEELNYRNFNQQKNNQKEQKEKNKDE